MPPPPSLSKVLASAVEDANTKVMRMSSDRIELHSTGMHTVPLDEIGGLLGGETTHVVGVGMTLARDPLLRYLMVMTPEGRRRIVLPLVGEAALDDPAMMESVLEEMGNILGSTLANALATSLGRDLRTGTPELIADLAGAILSSVVGSLPDVADPVPLLDVSFRADGEAANASMFLFFEASLAEKLCLVRGQ